MEKKEFILNLKSAFAQNGLSDLLGDDSAEKLYLFSQTLIETNKLYNLTAITDEKQIILKHFVDCASVCKYIPLASAVIDIGCGAGFPTLPLAILRNDIKIVALDSTEKKVKFIKKTADDLLLKNVYPISARAEDFVKQNREKFDVAVSRAVARLNVLDELCLPFVKTGGTFVAMKSSRGYEEYEEAATGINILGGSLKLHDCIELSYNESSIEREIYVFEKMRPTPFQYPRNYSQISRKPL